MRRVLIELMSDGGEKWVEVDNAPGLDRTRNVVASPWVDKRTDCFCCTCWFETDVVSIDPYCRNHGWAGRRECETHDQPGKEVDVLSVEKYREEQRRSQIRSKKKSRKRRS